MGGAAAVGSPYLSGGWCKDVKVRSDVKPLDAVRK